MLRSQAQETLGLLLLHQSQLHAQQQARDKRFGMSFLVLDVHLHLECYPCQQVLGQFDCFNLSARLTRLDRLSLPISHAGGRLVPARRSSLCRGARY